MKHTVSVFTWKFAALALMLPLVMMLAQAQFSQSQKLLPSGLTDGDLFGRAMAFSADGTRAVVTSLFPDFVGAAYIFEFNGTVWEETAKLVPSDGVPSTIPPGPRFGTSAAFSADGETLLIGAFGATVNGQVNAGAAYVFRLEGGSWVEVQKLTPSDPQNEGYFGVSLDLNAAGTTALIGADSVNDYLGAAYIFNLVEGVWTQTDILTNSNPLADQAFGESVALDAAGDTALIGAIGGNRGGRAFVFQFNGADWTQQARLVSGKQGFFFGAAVDLDDAGTTALISAPAAGSQLPGAAYVYGFDGARWAKQRQLSAGNASFGSDARLSAAGDTALIGAETMDRSGAAYIFKRNGDAWTRWSKLSPADGEQGDGFGAYLTLSAAGDRVLVGAWFSNEPGFVNNSGSAYVFDDDGTAPPSNLIRNGGFEVDANRNRVPDNWKRVGGASAERVCNTRQTAVAYEQRCAYQFPAKAARVNRLTHDVSLSGTALTPGNALVLRADLFASGQKVNFVMRARISYVDATLPATVLEVNVNTATGGQYLAFADDAILAGEVKSIRVILQNGAGQGRVRADQLALYEMPASAELMRLPAVR